MHDANLTIRVEAKVIGKRRPTTTLWDVSLPPAFLPEATASKDPFRLRDLISYIVREEVRAFHQRQEERRLLHVLSPLEIANAASQGKITMGGADPLQPGPPNAEVAEDAAVQVALQGFTDGLYLVFLDGQRLPDLDAAIHPHPASTLLFLRLVALVGG